jgi:DNA-binding response OmpR family regulator
VLFVVHEGEQAPPGQPVNGVIEIDRLGPARLLTALREAIGLTTDDAGIEAPALSDAPDESVPIAAGGGGPVVRTVELAAEPKVTSGRRTRLVVADAVAHTRAILEPLCARQGWEVVFVESGFQALRIIRDSDVDLVLINPALHAAGVSGADIARTIKGAAQFRKLPLLFLLHPGETAPAAVSVDGTVDVDPSQPARILNALNAAMGRPSDAADDATIATALQAAPPESALDVPEHPVATAEAVTAAEPVAAEEPVALPSATADAAPVRDLHETVADEVRRLVALEARPLVEQAVGAMSREIETAQRLVQQEIDRLAQPSAIASELTTTLREEVLEELRRTIETVVTREAATEGRALMEAVIRRFADVQGQGIAEQVAATVAREMVPAIVEQVVQQEMERRPALPKLEDLLGLLRERILADVRRTVEEVASQRPDARASEAIDAAVRHYVAADGRIVAEQVVAAVAREVVPGLAERLVQQELTRLPSPATTVDQVLLDVRERVLEEARRAAEAIMQRQAQAEGRAIMETVVHRYVTTDGRGLAEQMLASLARDLVPALAERMIREELARQPSPAAKVDELLPELREQLVLEARRAVEGIARHYTETDGRAAIEHAMRQYAATQGAGIAEEVLRAAARDLVPALAERMIREELARVPPPSEKLDHHLATLRSELLPEARRTIEALAQRYAETDGRGIVQGAIREYAQAQARTADDVVRAVAREVVPVITDRLIRDEIARLRAEYRLP